MRNPYTRRAVKTEAINVNLLQAFLIKNTEIDRNKLATGDKTLLTALSQTLDLLGKDPRYVDSFYKNLLQFNKWLQKASGAVPMESKVADAIGLGMYNNRNLPSRITVTDSGKFYIATFTMSGANALYNLVHSLGFAEPDVHSMLPSALAKSLVFAASAESEEKFTQLSKDFYSKWGGKVIPLQAGNWRTWDEVKEVKRPVSIQFTPNGGEKLQAVTGFHSAPSFRAPEKVIVTIAVPK